MLLNLWLKNEIILVFIFKWDFTFTVVEILTKRFQGLRGVGKAGNHWLKELSWKTCFPWRWILNGDTFMRFETTQAALATTYVRSITSTTSSSTHNLLDLKSFTLDLHNLLLDLHHLFLIPKLSSQPLWLPSVLHNFLLHFSKITRLELLKTRSIKTPPPLQNWPPLWTLLLSAFTRAWVRGHFPFLFTLLGQFPLL